MAESTVSELFVNTPQYVEESTQGTTPTASPSFTTCGPVNSLSLKTDHGFVDVSQIGDEDLIAINGGLKSYESQMKVNLLNSTFIKYGTESANPGTPTGTVSSTLSILFSFYLNGTLTYVILKGSRVKSMTLTMEQGRPIEVVIDFVHTGILISDASHGLTTPTLVTAPSGTVWGHEDGGANPLTWNVTALDCKRFSVTINRNTTPDYILGAGEPHSSQPHGRRISGDFTNLYTVNTLETDAEAHTSRAFALVLKSATSTITFTGTVIVSYSRDNSADDSEAVIENCTFRATAVSVT